MITLTNELWENLTAQQQAEIEEDFMLTCSEYYKKKSSYESPFTFKFIN